MIRKEIQCYQFCYFFLNVSHVFVVRLSHFFFFCSPILKNTTNSQQKSSLWKSCEKQKQNYQDVVKVKRTGKILQESGGKLFQFVRMLQTLEFELVNFFTLKTSEKLNIFFAEKNVQRLLNSFLVYEQKKSFAKWMVL